MSKNIFDTLTWDEFWWTGNITLSFNGEPQDVEVMFYENSSDEEVSPIQKESLLTFLSKWDSLEKDIIQAVFGYYNEEREELGFDEEDGYPEIATPEEIYDMVEIENISVTYPDTIKDYYNGSYVNIRFTCSWDEENGLGVILQNEEVTEVSADAGL